MHGIYHTPYMHKVFLIHFFLLFFCFVLLITSAQTFLPSLFLKTIIFITPEEPLSSFSYVELLNVVSSSIFCFDIATSNPDHDLESLLHKWCALRIEVLHVFIQPTRDITVLVFWESENNLFREEFYRIGISRGRTECEYVTASTEFQKGSL